MKCIKLLFLLLIPFLAAAQTGTSEDPFTTLGQAWSVSSSGIYYFNIDGTAFSTYVESGSGWVLVASGSAATNESSYSTTTSLTLQSDKILPVVVYTASSITAVRMNATSGPNIPFDVQSTAAGVLNNLKNDITLSTNTNSTDWTGTGTEHLQRSCAGNSASLSTHIYHACGNTNGMHWQVGRDVSYEKVQLSSADKNDLNLWVRADADILPVKIINFQAVPSGNIVQLYWQSALESGSQSFIVERSGDGLHWEALTTVGAGSNFSDMLSYTATDKAPLATSSFYRLKQVDAHEGYTYSKVVHVTPDVSSGLIIFPNPVLNGLLNVKLVRAATIRVFSSAGVPVMEKELPAGTHQLNLTTLPAGLYRIQAGNKMFPFIKQ